jgi:GntR family transcriptional regulator
VGFQINGSLAYSIPLYIQIAEGLIGQIESGELSPGHRLPPERDLSGRLGVNRMTLRRALRILEAQGVITRIHGVGTFIAAPKIERPLEGVFRFTRGMQNRGYTPGSQLISLEQLPIDRAHALELQISVSDPAYSLIRLRTLNQEPVLLETYLIPAQRFPGLERHDLEGRSVYEIMETEYGIPIVRARQSYEPVLASSYEAELLGVRAGAPLMMETRISYDQADRPIEFGRDRYRGDRFRFVTETEPNRNMQRQIAPQIQRPLPGSAAVNETRLALNLTNTQNPIISSSDNPPEN